MTAMPSRRLRLALPGRVRPDLLTPADSLWPGQTPIQEARWWAEANWAIERDHVAATGSCALPLQPLTAATVTARSAPPAVFPHAYLLMTREQRTAPRLARRRYCVPGGVVGHGLGGDRRTAQEVAGHHRGDRVIGGQVVDRLDLLLDALRGVDLPAHHAFRAVVSPPGLSAARVGRGVGDRLETLLLIGDAGEDLVDGVGDVRSPVLLRPA